MPLRESRIRSRHTPSDFKSGEAHHLGTMWLKYNWYQGGNWVKMVGGESLKAQNLFGFRDLEWCEDEIHTRTGTKYLIGGNFEKVRYLNPAFKPIGTGSHVSPGPVNLGFYYGTPDLVKYEGGFSSPYFKGNELNNGLFDHVSDITTLPSQLNANLESMGPTAWRKTKPRIEHGGLAVAAAEIRDIPRMLQSPAKDFHDQWRSVASRYPRQNGWRMAPKKAANQFLNYQFGWAPFISDVNSVANNIMDADRIIREITRNNGRSVRRRRVLEKSLKVHTLWEGPTPTLLCEPQMPSGMFVTPPYATVSMEESIETWAVGRFRYYIPYFDDSDNQKYLSALNTVRRHLAIHGLRVSPSNLYRATPWSWMADWVSNLGDNVDNANSMLVDQMSSQYFYLMHHRVTAVILTQVLPFGSGTVTLTWRRVIETKQRTDKVNPFGFSLSTELTGRQIAILAALGTSRNQL